MPNRLRAGALLPGVTHKVVVSGRNFTSQTLCVIDSVSAPTRWISSNLIECQFSGTGVAQTNASL
jgi:hypothetical protein